MESKQENSIATTNGHFLANNMISLCWNIKLDLERRQRTLIATTKEYIFLPHCNYTSIGNIFVWHRNLISAAKVSIPPTMQSLLRDYIFVYLWPQKVASSNNAIQKQVEIPWLTLNASKEASVQPQKVPSSNKPIRKQSEFLWFISKANKEASLQLQKVTSSNKSIVSL